MNQFFKWKSLIIKISLGYLLVTMIFIGVQVTNSLPVSALSNSSINAEITSLRSRISRVEQEVRRLSNSSNRSNIPRSATVKPPPNRNNSTRIREQAIAGSEPTYDRLATLLIELKEDVRNIDQRLTEIEKRF